MQERANGPPVRASSPMSWHKRRCSTCRPHGWTNTPTDSTSESVGYTPWWIVFIAKSRAPGRRFGFSGRKIERAATSSAGNLSRRRRLLLQKD